MKYYKLELVNREENYNQRFGRKTNVGVLSIKKTSSSKANNTMKYGGGQFQNRKSNTSSQLGFGITNSRR